MFLLLQAILSLFRRPPERLKDLPQPPHRTRGWELIVSFLLGGTVLFGGFWGLYVAVTKPTAETLEKQRERRSATMRDEPESQPFSVSLVSFEDTSAGKDVLLMTIEPPPPESKPVLDRPVTRIEVPRPDVPALVPKVDLPLVAPAAIASPDLAVPSELAPAKPAP